MPLGVLKRFGDEAPVSSPASRGQLTECVCYSVDICLVRLASWCLHVDMRMSGSRMLLLDRGNQLGDRGLATSQLDTV